MTKVVVMQTLLASAFKQRAPTASDIIVSGAAQNGDIHEFEPGIVLDGTLPQQGGLKSVCSLYPYVVEITRPVRGP